MESQVSFDPIMLDIVINNGSLDFLIKLYNSSREFQDFLDLSEQRTILLQRFGIPTNVVPFYTAIEVIRNAKKELYGDDVIVYEEPVYDYGNQDDCRVGTNIIISTKYITDNITRTFINHSTDAVLPNNWVWRYFAYIDITSPYYRAMIGEIPLTPDIFEVLAEPYNMEAGEETFSRLSKQYIKRSNQEFDENEEPYGSKKADFFLNDLSYNREMYVSSNIPASISNNTVTTGWTKSQLRKAILDSGVTLNMSLITGNVEDTDPLPGFLTKKKHHGIPIENTEILSPELIDSSTFSALRKIYYQQLYRVIFNTKNLPVNWLNIGN